MEDTILGVVVLTLGILLALPLSAWLERRSARKDKEAYERFFGTGSERIETHPTFDPWSRRV